MAPRNRTGVTVEKFNGVVEEVDLFDLLRINQVAAVGPEEVVIQFFDFVEVVIDLDRLSIRRVHHAGMGIGAVGGEVTDVVQGHLQQVGIGLVGEELPVGLARVLADYCSQVGGELLVNVAPVLGDEIQRTDPVLIGCVDHLIVNGNKND